MTTGRALSTKLDVQLFFDTGARDTLAEQPSAAISCTGRGGRARDLVAVGTLWAGDPFFRELALAREGRIVFAHLAFKIDLGRLTVLDFFFVIVFADKPIPSARNIVKENLLVFRSNGLQKVGRCDGLVITITVCGDLAVDLRKRNCGFDHLFGLGIASFVVKTVHLTARNVV
jgi:hypothetical protein